MKKYIKFIQQSDYLMQARQSKNEMSNNKINSAPWEFWLGDGFTKKKKKRVDYGAT